MQADEDVKIFLFDRRALSIPSSSLRIVNIEPFELYVLDPNVQQEDLQVLAEMLKDTYSTPLLRALPDYLKHFLIKLQE